MVPGVNLTDRAPYSGADPDGKDGHDAARHSRGAAPAPGTSPTLYRACLAGQEPAEALDRADRQHLVYDLWRLGWTDAEIATHTRMSTYTAARIRARIGLPVRPHTETQGVA